MAERGGYAAKWEAVQESMRNGQAKLKEVTADCAAKGALVKQSAGEIEDLKAAVSRHEGESAAARAEVAKHQESLAVAEAEHAAASASASEAAAAAVEAVRTELEQQRRAGSTQQEEAALEAARLSALVSSREEELASVRGDLDQHTASLSKELQDARDEAAERFVLQLGVARSEAQEANMLMNTLAIETRRLRAGAVETATEHQSAVEKLKAGRNKAFEVLNGKHIEKVKALKVRCWSFVGLAFGRLLDCVGEEFG